MTIHFNPYFDDGAYVNLASRGGMLYGEKVVGPLGLLSELEERLGTAGVSESEVERIVHYVKAMRRNLEESPDQFYAESFRNDEIGTARTLLRWRDAAIVAGWDPQSEQPTDKFKGLAAIERHFTSRGLADRWRSLRENLKSLTEITMDCRIVAHCTESCIEPHIKAILDRLVKLGISVVYESVTDAAAPVGTALRKVQDELLNPSTEAKPGERTSLSEDGSIRILHFSDLSDAQQWAATVLPDQKDLLLVNSSNNAVSDILFSRGEPTVSASIEVDSTAAQVFRLGLSLFRSPVDVNNLLAYLRLPVNPVSSVYVRKESRSGEVYYRSLNRVLADSLIDTGGLSEWQAIIDSADYDHDGNPAKPGTKAALLGRLYMWDKTKDGNARKSDVLEYLENLCSWCSGFVTLLDDPSWTLVKDLTEAFRLLMENEPDEIPLSKLLNWSDGLSLHSSRSVHRAQVGSIPTVGNIRCLFDGPKDLVWLDCVGIDSTPFDFDYLSPSERRYLAGGYLPKEDCAAAGHDAVIAALSRVQGSLTLVTYDTDHGALCAEHPIVTELTTRFAIPMMEGTIPSELLNTGDLVGAIPNKAAYQIDPALLEGRKRETESYSSLSELFQSPFDYVLDYLLKYGSYGETTIINVDAVKGTVAHKYIEDLINDCNKDVAAMRSLHLESYEDRILASAQNVGVVMLSDENRLEFAKFRSVLRKSVLSVLDFIESNGFSIYGTEHEVKTELPVIGSFYAKIDLLLKNADGDFVIVDFKWSESSYYVHALEKERILQLALYKAAVERQLGVKVLTTGYFILPKYNFFTIHDIGLKNHENVTVVGLESYHDVFDQACNSYRYRMDQLKTGLIEEGEGFEMLDLQYEIDTEEFNLYPLEGEYDNEGIKAVNHWGKNIILKGGLV